MKKLLFIFTVLLMSGIGSAMAQSINGSWKANKEVKNQFEWTDDDTDVDMLLVFSGGNMSIKVLVKSTDKEVGIITMSYTFPGSFEKTGNKYHTTFNKEKAVFKIDDIVTTDPDMKGLMADPDSKKMILDMIESTVKKERSDNGIKDMLTICDVFEEFEVASVTSRKLELKIADTMTFGFDRQ